MKIRERERKRIIIFINNAHKNNIIISWFGLEESFDDHLV